MKYLPSSLVGIFTVTSLYAANAARISVGDIWIPLVAAILIGLFFTFLFTLNKWTAKSAPFIASIWTAIFLLWNLISPIVSVVFLIMSIFVGVKFKTLTAEKVIRVVCIIAIMVSIVSASWIKLSDLNFDLEARGGKFTIDPQGKPNIYFIVPDRMPSILAMNESGIDTTDFQNQLEVLGFYVKPDQISLDQYAGTGTEKVSTTRTMRFFASVLNNDLAIDMKMPYKECKNLIQNPVIINTLHAQGYTFINIETWFAETAGINADVKLKYTNPNLYDRIFTGEFNTAFWERTIIAGLNFKSLLPQGVIIKNEQARHLWQASTLENLSMQDGQNFVMAHIILPHEPFVWTADGQPQYAKLSNPELYLEQIKFARGYIVTLATNIRKNDPTAIIIIQSDEGMAYRNLEEKQSLSPTQWNGVLTAWYIPNACLSCTVNLEHTGILKYVLGITK